MTAKSFCSNRLARALAVSAVAGVLSASHARAQDEPVDASLEEFTTLEHPLEPASNEAALRATGEGAATDSDAGSEIGAAAAAQAAGADELAPGLAGMDERVSLDLRNTDVTDALKYLATKGGLNIAISKNVSGRVNLFLTDVPIKDVFDLVLRSNELAFDRQGNIYNIMTESEYRALYGRRFADAREVRTFRLQYAIPEQAFNLLDTLKSEVGRLLVDEDSGTVLVLDTPDNLRQMDQALATLEQDNTVRVFDLKYAKAKDVEERLKDDLELRKLGTVKADERTNQLVVKTLPNRMKELEGIVSSLDRKTREVLIDAKIVKVTLNDDLDAGINWDSIFTNIKFHGVDYTGDFRDAIAGTAPSETPAVTKIKIPIATGPGRYTDNDVNFGELAFTTINTTGYELFRYLQTLGKTKVMSNPRLLVTESQEARIHVGTREAYVTTTTTTGQTTTTTAEEVEFIDVGIQLLVTPHINTEGFVTMKVKPEISSVVRTLETPSGNNIPIVDTSTAETNVVVKDGATVIIGGLQKTEEANQDRQVPYLGHIPIIGPTLFRTRAQDNERAELVVFITPHIVAGDKLITGDEKEFGGDVKSYREYAPLLGPPAPTLIPSAPMGRLDEPD
jgi:type IV pilus assembly protein PilQ